MVTFNPYSPQYYCCCGKIRSKVGCRAVGIFEGLCLAVFFGYLVYQITRFETIPDGFFVYFVIATVAVLVGAFIIAIMFIGLQKEDCTFLLPHLFWQLCAILFTMVYACLALALVVSNSLTIADWLSGGAASAVPALTDNMEVNANESALIKWAENWANDELDGDDDTDGFNDWRTHYVFVDPDPIREYGDNGTVLFRNGFRRYGGGVLLGSMLHLALGLWLFSVVYGCYRMFADQESARTDGDQGVGDWAERRGKNSNKVAPEKRVAAPVSYSDEQKTF